MRRKPAKSKRASGSLPHFQLSLLSQLSEAEEMVERPISIETASGEKLAISLGC